MRNASGFFLALFLVSGGTLAAQITGDVKGVVTDPSGGSVAQAKVTLTSLETGQARVQKADDGGRFTFDQLRIGDYELKVEARGFRPASTAARVRTGETADVAFRLELGAVTESVTVADAASLLDTTNSQMHFSVEGPALRALPVRRDPIQFIQLAPGIAPVGPNDPLLG